MFEYKVRFKGDDEILFSKDGFESYEDAEFWATEAIGRACEKCEEWEPDKTYIEDDFEFIITNCKRRLQQRTGSC